MSILGALERHDARQVEDQTRRHIQNTLAELGGVLGISAALDPPLPAV